MERRMLNVIIDDNIRKLLAQANSLALNKEHIVSIQKIGEEYILIYCK